MDRVTLLMLAGLAIAPYAWPAPGVAEPVGAVQDRLDRWQPFIAEAATRFAIPEAWIRAVMQAESGGRTRLDGRPITSRAGAMGLMQVMPDTYEAMRARHDLGDDPHDPRDNILAGAAYLRAMYERFGFPGLFAAYNAGPGRYAEHLRAGRPLPAETRAYLAALGSRRSATPSARAVASGRSLFFTLRTTATAPPDIPDASVSGGLFVPLRTVPGSRR
ncbi:lytic transglycosylase domain-containing protein [Rhodoligotrophos defluvii]|uniref:lytic transglycosylase domain-containing protein n=1 Tax=Rhodoligotrophos defluvii TaxID=2561934 RepID=UPI0010C965A3|nr:lytic transglycosylase domain-containing protein [Rhodoligotrophos defluvii]